MKTASLALLLLLQTATSIAGTSFYKWSDADGVVHFTDDRNKIPAGFRLKARPLDLGEPEPAAAGNARPPSSPREPASASLADGHSEQWWRQRFAALRERIKALQDALPAKQTQLAELRRQRTLYQRSRDREAMNALEASIAADQTAIGELRDQLEALDQDAARAAVPSEWRR